MEFKEPNPLDHLTNEDLFGDIRKKAELDKMYVDLWNRRLISTETLQRQLGFLIEGDTDIVELVDV